MSTMVVVCTYNEAGNIERLTREILAQGENIGVSIVDDNSPDGTGEIADRLAQENGRVQVLHRNPRRGRAAAGIAGFKYALSCNEVENIIEMDADFSHDPKDIPRLLAEIESADVVIGSRFVEGGGFVGCSLGGRLRSRIINRYNRLVLGLDVMDSSGGYKCYRRHVLETIDLSNFVSKGYCVGVETLLKCRRHGFTLREIPILYREREWGTSKADLRVTVEYPFAVLALKIKDLRGNVR